MLAKNKLANTQENRMTDLKSLEVGMDAPDIEMEDADGVVHRLRGYVGSKNVVLAFYPKDFTSG